jgi:hypothetical protein
MTNFDLNDISYGNMSYENRSFIKKESVFNQYFEEFKLAQFPKNSSSEVQYELKSILDDFNKVQKSNKSQYYKVIDRALYNVFQRFLASTKITNETNIAQVMAFIEKVNLQLAPLILKLKEYYQRPRPYQLAPYYNIDLYPHQSLTALSPSYPSGHTLTAYFICGLISEVVPNKIRQLESFAEDVAASRIGLGLHYPSDNKFSIGIAEILITKKESEDFISELEKILVPASSN